MRFRLLEGVVCLGIFAAGVSFGVYYHQEIVVVGRYYLQSLWSGTGATPPPAATPPAPAAVQSTLLLATVEQPLPLVYSDTLDEDRLQEYLKEGAVVLPLGTSFGQPGNVVVTAHSSGTSAFGPYRFAFSKLSELKEGDEFKVATASGTYTYRVYAKEVVWPTQVDHLPQDDRSTVTLVTCWPLWTNFKRLLVHSELIKTAPGDKLQ